MPHEGRAATSPQDHETAVEAAASVPLTRFSPEVLERLQERKNGGDGDAEGETSALPERLLEVLKAEVVRGWVEERTDVGISEVLQTLHTLERIRLEVRGETLDAREPMGKALLAEIAHDMRSPLTSILTLADALRRGQSGPLNDLQRRQLGLVYSATLGLISVTSNFTELPLTRQFRPEDAHPLSVTDVLGAVRDIVSPMAEEKGLELEVICETSDRRVGWEEALVRVLLNLSVNALKFTEEGSVEIGARSRSPMTVEFAVADSGPGIEAESLTSLWTPFRPKRDGTGLRFSGTGLGLAICRRLVHAMGSELEVQTQVGSGTRISFKVDMPSSGWNSPRV